MSGIGLKRYELSIIVPVGINTDNFANLKSWIDFDSQGFVEIIIVNDVQDEVTSEALYKFLEFSKTNEIILIENSYGSPGAARNAGMKIARGNWITFWDSDDLPKISEVVVFLKKLDISDQNNVIIGQFDLLRVTSGKKISRNYSDMEIGTVALNPGIWRMLFKSDLLENITFNNHKMGEDQNFLTTIDLPSQRILYADIIFYTYCLGVDGQLTQRKSAIDEILKSAKFTLMNLKLCNVQSIQFNSILLVRQIITGLTRTSISIRFASFILLIKAFSTSNFKIKREILSILLNLFPKNRKSRISK